MQTYPHEKMAALKSNRIQTLSKVFNKLPPEPIKSVGSEAYGLQVYRAGISEIRVKAATYDGNAWSGWNMTAERVAKTRIKYLIVDDKEFYTTFVTRVHGVLDRMKLNKTHRDMCNLFLTGLVTELKELGLVDITPTKVK